MKPVLISEYLNYLGQDSSGDRQAPRRENAPPRPRPVLAANGAEPRSAAPVFRTLSQAAMAARPHNAQRQEADPAKWPAARRDADRAPSREPPAPSFEARIEEAYERGRQDGAAAARGELAEARARDIAARQEQSIVERLDFHLSEYAQLANVISAGLIDIEERVSACVARIVQPLVASGVTKQIVEELCANIGRLRAGDAPPLIRIRGPERLLHLLRERVAAISAEVEYIAEDRVEVRVEARDAVIESELQPWADLLASIENLE